MFEHFFGTLFIEHFFGTLFFELGQKVQRDFQLFRIEQTTPQRMYLRMIDAQEYGNALQIAFQFDLDSDLVYQRRWEMSPFNRHAINDFLSRIKKRSYIIEQCLQQIPTDLDDCRFLLQFGLRGTDLASLVELQHKSSDEIPFLPEEDSDEGKITHCDMVHCNIITF